MRDDPYSVLGQLGGNHFLSRAHVRLFVCTDLLLPQIVVQALSRNKRLVVSLLGDFCGRTTHASAMYEEPLSRVAPTAVLEHENQVAVRDGRQPVRNGNARPPFCQLAQ